MLIFKNIFQDTGLRLRTFDVSGPHFIFHDLSKGVFRNTLWGRVNYKLPPLIKESFSFEFEIPQEYGKEEITVNVLDGFFRAPKSGLNK